MEDNAIVTSVLLGLEPFILIRLTGANDEALSVDLAFGGGLKEEQVRHVISLINDRMQENV